jgi:hypothetical protein
MVLCRRSAAAPAASALSSAGIVARQSGSLGGALGGDNGRLGLGQFHSQPIDVRLRAVPVANCGFLWCFGE